MSSAFNTGPSGLSLSANELALPAVCAKTGKLFVMVGRRHDDRVLEIIRAVPIGFGLSVSGVQEYRATQAPTRSSIGGRSSAAPTGPELEPRRRTFDELSMSAVVEIASSYDGCPHCRATGYFICSNCNLFVCWNEYNAKAHDDHTDVWCAGCASWRCTSDNGEEEQPVDFTAYVKNEVEVSEQMRSVGAAVSHQQISWSASIKGVIPKPEMKTRRGLIE